MSAAEIQTIEKCAIVRNDRSSLHLECVSLWEVLTQNGTLLPSAGLLAAISLELTGDAGGLREPQRLTRHR
jgi:hypothetical protein